MKKKTRQLLILNGLLILIVAAATGVFLIGRR